MKLDFVGIGAPKCGTTWIGHQLASHPDIDFAKRKETNFYSSQSYLDSTSISPNRYRRIRSPKVFERQFVNDGRARGEFSTFYLYDDKALMRIKKSNPHTKIIVGIRDPVDALYSRYQFARSSTQANEYRAPLEQVVEQKKYLVDNYLFNKYLSQLKKVFPPAQILIIDSAAIRTDPHRVVKELYSFIGVDATYIPETLGQKSNQSARLRFPNLTRAASFIAKLFGALKLSWLLNALYPLYAKINRIAAAYEPLTGSRRERFLSYFEEDQTNLWKHLSSGNYGRFVGEK